ncbi:hypothetical protein [Bacillus sp. JCM 19041]
MTTLVAGVVVEVQLYGLLKLAVLVAGQGAVLEIVRLLNEKAHP